MSAFNHHHVPAAAPRGAAATLALLAAAWLAGCTAGQTPPPPESGAASAGTSAPSTASAPAAPAPAAAAPADPAPPAPAAAGSAPRPEAWPARQVLQQNSLAVATYRPGDPAACGLPAVQPGDGRTAVVVFHGCEPRSGPALDAVPARRVPVPAGADPLEAAVRAQLAGATEAEKAAGYRSNFGGAAATAFTVRRLEGGLVVVDLHPSIRQQRMAFVSNAEAKQLVAALGQFPGVERVAILVGGQPLCKALGQC